MDIPLVFILKKVLLSMNFMIAQVFLSKYGIFKS